MINEERMQQLAGIQIDEATDSGSTDELIIYIDNDQKMYNQKIAIYKNLSKKMKKGNYDSKLAAKGFKHLTDAAAKAYTKEYADYDYDFNMTKTKVRKDAAEELAKRFEQEYAGKEYDFMEESLDEAKLNTSEKSLLKKIFYDTKKGVARGPTSEMVHFVYNGFEFRGYEPEDVLEDVTNYIEKDGLTVDKKLVWGVRFPKPGWNNKWKQG